LSVSIQDREWFSSKESSFWNIDFFSTVEPNCQDILTRNCLIKCQQLSTHWYLFLNMSILSRLSRPQCLILICFLLKWANICSIKIRRAIQTKKDVLQIFVSLNIHVIVACLSSVVVGSSILRKFKNIIIIFLHRDVLRKNLTNLKLQEHLFDLTSFSID